MFEALYHTVYCIVTLHRRQSADKSKRVCIGKARAFSSDHQKRQTMRIIERICHGRMHLYAVELDQRGQVISDPNVQSTNSSKPLFECAVHNAAIRSYRQASPMLQIFARSQVERSSAWRTDAVAAYAEDHCRTVQRFGNRNECNQRMNFADLRIVFKPDVKTRMNTIDQRRAHRRPIDLSCDQSKSCGELLWVIGRPPDSLAFARSDRSGRNQRSVLRLRFLGLCNFFSFGYFWQQQLIQFVS